MIFERTADFATFEVLSMDCGTLSDYSGSVFWDHNEPYLKLTAGEAERLTLEGDGP